MKKTKKIITGVSFISTLLFLVLAFNSSSLYDYCYTGGHCIFWFNLIDSAIPQLLLYLSLIVFIFSLTTYFLRDEIFHAWLKFTYVWTPLSIFLVLITPGDTGGGFMPSLLDKEMVAIVMSGLFFIISLLIIIVKLVKPYWNK